MKNRSLTRIFSIIVISSLCLFWAIDLISRQTESSMSYLSSQDQQTLLEYGREAERLFTSGEEEALSAWLTKLQAEEQTWAAVVKGDVQAYANSHLNERFWEGYGLGRRVEWKIHLDFPENPIMEVPFAQKHWFFLIKLPDRMRPGGYKPHTYLALQLAIPFVLLCIMAWLLYQSLISPLRKLTKAAQAFSEGDLEARVAPLLASRNDEFSHLADTFDTMATRTSLLIKQQRALLENLSHELRTPLSRLELTVDSLALEDSSQTAIKRLRNESSLMRELLEDTLMLVWLNQEHTLENLESTDLVSLLNVICDDARFEFPEHTLELTYTANNICYYANQRALAQALENIIRNAHQHTPKGKVVRVHVEQTGKQIQVTIRDQGPGVPEAYLREMFLPFFQIGAEQKQNHIPLFDGKRKQGFGLGLALAKRQIHLIKGGIYTMNRADIGDQEHGLITVIDLPSTKVAG
ncbi:sensor histidine kinase [Marinomonas epiphytica]